MLLGAGAHVFGLMGIIAELTMRLARGFGFGELQGVSAP